MKGSLYDSSTDSDYNEDDGFPIIFGDLALISSIGEQVSSMSINGVLRLRSKALDVSVIAACEDSHISDHAGGKYVP